MKWDKGPYREPIKRDNLFALGVLIVAMGACVIAFVILGMLLGDT